MIPVLLLAAVTATFQPAAPAVGDRIVVEFAAPVTLDASPDYEILQHGGNFAVVRTFRPRPFALSGTAGNVRFRNLVVPVRSVLNPNDDLKPAPLKAPRPLPYPRQPFLDIAVAAAAALVLWLAAWRLARRAQQALEVPVIPADARFRLAVAAAKEAPERWAALADATRRYLAETRPQLGSDLTTTELVPRLRERERIVREILRQGDLEKFSLHGAEPEDFDDVARRALELAS